MPWIDELSWVEKISWSWEISWSGEIFWFKISWFDEISWVEKISWSCEISWYKWDPEKDKLSPGLGELNLNKKKRGEKKPNLEPIRTKTEQTLVRSVRDISIVYSVGEMLSNTVDHFNEPVKLSQLSHDLEDQLLRGLYVLNTDFGYTP